MPGGREGGSEREKGIRKREREREVTGTSPVTHIMVLSKVLKQALVFPGTKGEKVENEVVAFSVA